MRNLSETAYLGVDIWHQSLSFNGLVGLAEELAVFTIS